MKRRLPGRRGRKVDFLPIKAVYVVGTGFAFVQTQLSGAIRSGMLFAKYLKMFRDFASAS